MPDSDEDISMTSKVRLALLALAAFVSVALTVVIVVSVRNLGFANQGERCRIGVDSGRTVGFAAFRGLGCFVWPGRWIGAALAARESGVGARKINAECCMLNWGMRWRTDWE